MTPAWDRVQARDERGEELAQAARLRASGRRRARCDVRRWCETEETESNETTTPAVAA